MSLCLCAASSMADDDNVPAPVPVPAAASAPSPVVKPSIMASAPADNPSDKAEAARFATDAKWDLAGYNNDEVVYTILVTSHDTRIIRCTTQLSGSYFENGKKVDISDRQSSTVFPDQQVQVGNWMGMDQKSGATYSVKCRAL
jgi:hypothetical protein